MPVYDVVLTNADKQRFARRSVNVETAEQALEDVERRHPGSRALSAAEAPADAQPRQEPLPSALKDEDIHPELRRCPACSGPPARPNPVRGVGLGMLPCADNFHLTARMPANFLAVHIQYDQRPGRNSNPVTASLCISKELTFNAAAPSLSACLHVLAAQVEEKVLAGIWRSS